MSARTERFSHTYFPYCVREWDQLDSNTRTQLTVTSLQRKLIEIIRPEKRSTFKVSDINGVKRLTRLRVKFSDLPEHKFRHNLYVTPICMSSEDTETTRHYLLRCQLYADLVRSSSTPCPASFRTMCRPFRKTTYFHLFCMVRPVSMEFQTVQFWNQLLNVFMALVVSLATCDSPCEIALVTL